MDDSRENTSQGSTIVGRLEGSDFATLLCALSRDGRSGSLRVTVDGFRKTLLLDAGQVRFAASDDPEDRIGTRLVRRGVITLDQLERVVERLHSGPRIGSLLVEDGSLTPDQLVDEIRLQTRAIALGLFDRTSGEYRFHDGAFPQDESITLEDSTASLVVQGLRSIHSLARLRRAVGGPTTTYGLRDDWEEALAGIEPDEGQQLLLERLQLGDESVDNLCQELFLSNFEIYQNLWAFKVLSATCELGVGDSAEFGIASRAYPGFVEFLLELCKAGETGVLHARRRDVERTFHLRRGQVIFATSSSLDDGLIAYLFRRGMVSLRDAEEVVQRLLSNKRVGKILRELGVLDDDDLRDAVRQQVTEIVYDTFDWGPAEYGFVEGGLPSSEEITLDPTLEQLIATGIRRIRSWSRVREGCGGLDSVLSLTPNYLDVLDAMHGGVEEWEIVNSLKTPRTPAEVCRMTRLGDFRVCQGLWTLRLLGGVEVLQPEAEREASPAIEPTEAERLIEVPLVEMDGPDVAEVETRTAEIDLPGAPPSSTPLEAEPQPEAEATAPAGPGRASEPAVSETPEADSLAAAGIDDEVPVQGPAVQEPARDSWAEPSDDEDSAPVEADSHADGEFEGPSWTGPEPTSTGTPVTDAESPVEEPDRYGTSAETQEDASQSQRSSPLDAQDVESEVDPVDDSTATSESVEDVLHSASYAAYSESTDTDSDHASDASHAERDEGFREPPTSELPSTDHAPLDAPAASGSEDASPAPADHETLDADEALDRPGEPWVDDESTPARTKTAGPSSWGEPATTDETVAASGSGDPQQSELVASEPLVSEKDSRNTEGPPPTIEWTAPDAERPAGSQATSTGDQSVRHGHDQVADRPRQSEVPTDGPGGDPGSRRDVSFDEIAWENRDSDEARAAERGVPLEKLEAALSEAQATGEPAAAEPSPDERSPLGDKGSIVEQQVVTGSSWSDALEEEGGRATPPSEPREEGEQGAAAEPAVDLEPARTSETVRVTREEIESALGDDTGDAGWEPAAAGPTFDDGWQPPEELDRDIARFNAVQRIVYRTVRAEVGAGAANFIRSCCSSSDGTPAEPVHGAELLADGSWDAEGLRSAVQDARIEQPWDAYQRLIQREIEILRAHIGEARAAELEQLIEQAYQDEDRA